MNQQDRNYLKALAFLYGKDTVPIPEYQKHLEKVFGTGWHTIYQELDKDGFLKPNNILSPSQKSVPYSYSMTEAGTVYYESLIGELEQVQKERKEARSGTNWIRITGWGMILLLLMTGFLISLELKRANRNESRSSALDSAVLAGYNHAIDSMNKRAPVQTIDSSGAVLDAEIPAPPMPKHRVMDKSTRPVKANGMADSLDPLPPQKRTDTLHGDSLPALQKEIRNTADSVR